MLNNYLTALALCLLLASCANTVAPERPVLIIENADEMHAPAATSLGHGTVTLPDVGAAYYDYGQGRVLVHKNGQRLAGRTYSRTSMEGSTRTFYE
jgi:hypothetical protein